MGVTLPAPKVLSSVFFSPVIYGAVASLAIILSTWHHGDKARDKLQQKFESKEDTFDFIVVGSGSAGSVVASRLSEHYTVLLLEAGGDPHPLQAIPGFAVYLPNHPEIDWMHKTITQRRACFSSPNGQCTLSGGKNLGGSGNLNLMISLRGSPKDYDNWAKLTGDPSWSYEGVLPYFQRYEDFKGNSTELHAHGKGGPVKLGLSDYKSIASQYIWAADELGYPQVDLNGHFVEGFDHTLHPIEKGVRQATYRSYIKLVKKLSNLNVKKFAHVNKVLIRGKYNTAYGVEYERHGKTYYAYAKKEVILSAGAIQSPKLLMLSGVGPWKHLKDMGIPIKADLPVGKNLQDHLSTPLGPFTIDKPSTLQLDTQVTPKSFVAWKFGLGPLTSTSIVASGMTVSSLAKSRGEWDWPDIQLHLSALSIHKTSAKTLSKSYGIKKDILTEYYEHAVNKNSFSIIATAGRPVARGEILLGGMDPYDPLLIDPKYVADPWNEDIKVMIEAIRLSVKMVEETQAMAYLNAHFTNQVFPGCEKFKFGSDLYWECYIRHYSVPLHHLCGTAAMGRIGSPSAVVDTELQVIGVKHLRVVDASVMPSIVGGATEAATIMIAEKGAEMIIHHWEDGGQEKVDHHSSYEGVDSFITPEQIHSSSDSEVIYEPYHTYIKPVEKFVVSRNLQPLKISPYEFIHLEGASRRKRDVINFPSRALVRNISAHSFPKKKERSVISTGTTRIPETPVTASIPPPNKISFSELFAKYRPTTTQSSMTLEQKLSNAKPKSSTVNSQQKPLSKMQKFTSSMTNQKQSTSMHQKQPNRIQKTVSVVKPNPSSTTTTPQPRPTITIPQNQNKTGSKNIKIFRYRSNSRFIHPPGLIGAPRLIRPRPRQVWNPKVSRSSVSS